MHTLKNCYSTFKVSPEGTIGQVIVWDIKHLTGLWIFGGEKEKKKKKNNSKEF